MRAKVGNSGANFNTYRTARVSSLSNAESGAEFDLDADLDIDDQNWRIGEGVELVNREAHNAAINHRPESILESQGPPA